MTRHKIFSGLLILAVAALPTLADAQHYAISGRTIAATISKTGIAVLPNQVTPLSDVGATTPTPVLKVRSVEKQNNQTLLARMECETSDECLPFFVSVRLGQGSGSQTDANPADAVPAALLPQAGSRSTVLRAGSMATLQLDGDHIHIRIPVICLQNGGLGQTIRVTDKSHRLVYAAEVIDKGLVKGRLH